jgi:hypothetical protein
MERELSEIISWREGVSRAGSKLAFHGACFIAARRGSLTPFTPAPYPLPGSSRYTLSELLTATDWYPPSLD